MEFGFDEGTLRAIDCGLSLCLSNAIYERSLGTSEPIASFLRSDPFCLFHILLPYTSLCNTSLFYSSLLHTSLVYISPSSHLPSPQLHCPYLPLSPTSNTRKNSTFRSEQYRSKQYSNPPQKPFLQRIINSAPLHCQLYFPPPDTPTYYLTTLTCPLYPKRTENSTYFSNHP